MEDTDSNLGTGEKELALDEKIKKLISEVEKDEEGNILENPILEINGQKFELELKKEEKENIYKIHILGVHILTLDENGELSFAEGWKELLQEQLKENKAKINGEELIKSLEEMEIQLEEKKGQMEEEQLHEEGKEEDEKAEDEKPELEDEKQKEEIAKKYDVDAKDIIHVSLNEKVTRDEKFDGLVNWADGYEDVYMIPDRPDRHKWMAIGIRDGEQEEIEQNEMQQIKGNNPNVKIKQVEGEEIKEVTPLAMYDIDGESGIAFIEDDFGQPEQLYYRKEAGEEEYWGAIIPEQEGKNTRQESQEARNIVSKDITSDLDLDEFGDNFEKVSTHKEDLKERGVPLDNSMQIDEVKGAEESKDVILKTIAEDLAKKDKIPLSSAFPGLYDAKAKKVYELMLNNKSIKYNDAIEQVEKQEKRDAPEEGRMPGTSRTR